MIPKQAQTGHLGEKQQMEKDRKKKKIEKQISSERSPLKELKRIPRCNTAILPSSTSVSVEAPRGCLRFLLSANSNSSSSSSVARTQCQRKPKSFSKKSISTTPRSAPTSTRLRSKVSKENDLPRVTSQKPKKNPSFLSQWQSGKKPSLKTSRASRNSSNLSHSLKISESCSVGFGSNGTDLRQRELERNCSTSGQPSELFSFKVSDNLNSIEKSTPVGKLPCWSALDPALFDDKPIGGDSNSTNTKTPPIEPSVSPEIQSGVSNLLVSATPVCYGTGHLLSGVADKRKCKPRGILIIGSDDVNESESACGKTSVVLDHGNDIGGEVLAKSRPSFIPLPTEASMKWLSSEDDKVHKSDSVDQCITLLSSSSIALPSPPSNYSLPSDLASHSDHISQSSNVDLTAGTGKTRIVLLSPRMNSNSQGSSGPTPKKLEADLLSTSPQTQSSCDIYGPLQEGNLSYMSISKFSIGEKSPHTDILSVGNVVQTPKSDSSLDRLIDIFHIEADDSQRNEYNLEIDSVAETFDRTSLSPRSHMLRWDLPGFSSQLTDVSPPSRRSINELDNCASWHTDSTLQNVSLSQMRISWRDGLGNRILDLDEFDCCRCLSDEEKDDGLSDKLGTESPVAVESTKIEKQNGFDNDGLVKSPKFLEQEPRILGKGKGKENLSPRVPNVCAESISTDGGGLVVSSGDSDWTLCYKNHLFEVYGGG
ncbi:hypothetical protein M9H77_19911 [Catharanthus roseus]|uniref:Uncharacterized protein n=1 Tax=Catharanthus roseus TaxID=4058 RepID=A0ACC0BBW7_CATRO|nr:hypothetical protein M9H77_19911 [Catharanthus roseus]